MGNKTSSDNSGRTKRQDASGIIREGPPPSMDHPDSGMVIADPRALDVVNLSSNFSLRLRNSGLIDGKHVAGKSVGICDKHFRKDTAKNNWLINPGERMYKAENDLVPDGVRFRRRPPYQHF